jgi:aminopeptidase N
LKRTFVIILSFFFLFSPWLLSVERPKSIHYHLKVNIEPASAEISVLGKIRLSLKDPHQREFSFDLHQTFTLEKLHLNGTDVKYSSKDDEPVPLMPAAKQISVILPPKYDRSEIVMDITYSGKLKDIPEFGGSEDQQLALDDQINSRMVELACYSCWYPFFEFGNKFDVDLEVSLPRKWKCVCSGDEVETHQDNDRSLSRWTANKDIDIVIVASPELKKKTVQSSAADIDIYFTQLPEEYVNKEAEDIEKSLRLFTEILGNPRVSGSAIKHVYSPKRKGQGSFSRTGMIVSSEGRTLEELTQNPHVSFLQGLAHEMAHFWWNFGRGQGDWINETFAEYFSLVAVQKISSQAEFADRIKEYKGFIEELPEDVPSLAKVPPSNDEVGYMVRYCKGCLMLDYFRNLTGDPKFFEISRDFYQTFKDTLIGTEEFRSFWKERLAEHDNLLELWLDSQGGMPALNKKVK